MATEVTPQRILVCGDVNGKLKALFDRVNAVSKKGGAFDMLVCAGSFFSDEDGANNDWIDLMSGKSDLKVPTTPIYVLGPQSEAQQRFYEISGGPDWEQGFEVLDGAITFLGKKGTLNSASGLVVAYMSTEEGEELLESAQTVDLLITTRWPQGISRFVSTVDVKEEADASPVISRIVRAMMPRYHLSSSRTIFFERQPYRNHIVLSEMARTVTRFVSCAPVGNSTKAKWLYAFSITPAKQLSKSELVKQPEDTTENPFKDLRLENTLPKEEDTSGVQFFYDMNSRGGHRGRGRGGRGGHGDDRRQRQEGDGRGPQGDGEPQAKRPPRPQIDPATCWFCLSSPDVEKHLVVAIGEHAYLAAAKGGLNDDHLLILPINHIRSTLEAEEAELITEIERFKDCLRSYFRELDQEVVFFERNFRSSHLQIQVVPVPNRVVDNLEKNVKELIEEQGLQVKLLPEGVTLKESLNPGVPYFFLGED